MDIIAEEIDSGKRLTWCNFFVWSLSIFISYFAFLSLRNYYDTLIIYPYNKSFDYLSFFVFLIVVQWFFCVLLFVAWKLAKEDKIKLSDIMFNMVFSTVHGFILCLIVTTVNHDGYMNDLIDENYSNIQKAARLSDKETYYSNLQHEFLVDKKNGNFNALKKYIGRDNDLKSIDNKELTALILSMENIKDNDLLQEFNKIIKDNVVTINEQNEFNNFVLAYQMKKNRGQ